MQDSESPESFPSHKSRALNADCHNGKLTKCICLCTTTGLFIYRSIESIDIGWPGQFTPKSSPNPRNPNPQLSTSDFQSPNPIEEGSQINRSSTWNWDLSGVYDFHKINSLPLFFSQCTTVEHIFQLPLACITPWTFLAFCLAFGLSVPCPLRESREIEIAKKCENRKALKWQSLLLKHPPTHAQTPKINRGVANGVLRVMGVKQKKIGIQGRRKTH